MRREGMSQAEVARRFNLSPSRVYLIEKQDAATRAMEGRRARMIKQLQDTDDMDKLCPVEDLLDALGSTSFFRFPLATEAVVRTPLPMADGWPPWMRRMRNR
jgi:hypothetical protein